MTGRLGMFVLLLGSAYAQLNTGSAVTMGHIRVKVSFTSNSSCALDTRVELAASTGVVLAENAVDSQCVAEFFDIPAGNYSVRVVGAEVADAEKSALALSPGMTEEVDVRARRAGEAAPSPSAAASAFVSVSDLEAPFNAQREFDKASQLISKKEWEKASERLHKAITIYPRYASAYNNLGAVYSHLGDRTQARAALETAIALNDHLASAYVNLARLSFAVREFAEVETDLDRALTLAAPDTEEFTLLAVAQLADRHFDRAIETSRRAHRSQLSHHAFLHLVAARAEDMQGKADASVSEELQQYLNEEPNGAHAEEVKKSLALMGTQSTVH